MKHLKIAITLFMLLSYSIGNSQNSKAEYSNLIRDGWASWMNKNSKKSVALYEKAFKLRNDVPLSDRYNLSCIYALTGDKNAAFKHLFIVANDLKWDDYNHLTNDSDLISLHKDKRWTELKKLVKQNKEKAEVGFDKELVSVLDAIYFDDQSTRNNIRSMEEKHGRGSEEMDAFWQTILKKDSINLIKVGKILEERGWPSKDIIGKRGTSTLFLVIQHANQDTHEKYLPMIQKAVADNNLPKNQYAMFYDRLVLTRGELQVYGTQLAMDNKSKSPYVLPLIDPVNVDKRRIEMGLNTMQKNLNRWSLTWDVEVYIKDLPQIILRKKEMDAKNE